MSVDFTRLFPVDEIVGEGDGMNYTVSTREEFDTLWENAVVPLMARIVQDETEENESTSSFQSLVLYMTSVSTVREEDEKDQNYEENYILALTGDAVYLKFMGIEDEAWGDGETEYICQQIEYYVKGSEIYARVLRCDYIENGVKQTESDLQ